MKFDPNIHHRRSIRLKEYDYSQPGAYFVTLVTKGRECLFGEVIEGDMWVNQYGKIVQRTWLDLPRHYPYITPEAFIAMPNHIHAIIALHPSDTGRGGSVPVGNSMPNKSMSGGSLNPDGRQTRPYGKTFHGLPEIVRALKSFSARRINQIRETPGVAIWQRNYYEHIVRNLDELNRISLYIADNPRLWVKDQENPEYRG